MSRHHDYPNLKLIYGDEWRGLPLGKQAPYGERYLEVNLNVMRSAIERHRRSFVVLFVLRLPYGYAMPAKGLISRFMKSLKAQVQADLNARSTESGRRLQSDVTFLWAREKSGAENCHFHVAIFLNRDVYNSIGNYELQWCLEGYDFFAPGRPRAGSLHHRLTRAWATALGIFEEQGVGLVDYPRNAEYHLDAHDIDFPFTFADLFGRLSYMAKIRTKDYRAGADCYGSSRVPGSEAYFPDYEPF